MVEKIFENHLGFLAFPSFVINFLVSLKHPEFSKQINLRAVFVISGLHFDNQQEHH